MSVSQAALFIAFLVRKGYKPATVSTYVSAIGYVHKLKSLPDPTSSFLILQILRACHKNGSVTDTRLPIDRPMLGKLMGALDHIADSKRDCVLFKAMFALAFHAFLRIGEITVKRGALNPHLLQFSNLKMDKDQLVLSFSSYKHSQGRVFSIKIPASMPSTSCALRALQEYLVVRGTSPGPLFLFSSKTAVSRMEFDRVLKRALIFNSVSPTFFKGHSFWIGAATAAAEAGLSDSRIRELGRWKSDAFKKYIRASLRTSAL